MVWSTNLRLTWARLFAVLFEFASGCRQKRVPTGPLRNRSGQVLSLEIEACCCNLQNFRRTNRFRMTSCCYLRCCRTNPFCKKTILDQIWGFLKTGQTNPQLNLKYSKLLVKADCFTKIKKHFSKTIAVSLFFKTSSVFCWKGKVSGSFSKEFNA